MQAPSNNEAGAPPTRVGELHTVASTVPARMPCRQVHSLMSADALLPGVIVLDADGALLGLMSRQRFMEFFSKSYRSEIYFGRPLEKLLQEAFDPPMLVDAYLGIAQAAEAALNRPHERFNEPLAVHFDEAPHYRILEIRDLLYALANIHAHQFLQLQLALDSLVQAEKMASLGSLVAGVAHEINTPVGVSLTAASHLVDQIDVFDSQLQSQQLRKSDLQTFVRNSREAGGMILNNMERAASLVRSFKQVAADQASERRRSFDLRQTVGEILFNLRPSFKHSPVELDHDIEADITMDAFPGALAQILSNLVLNAQIHGFEAGASGHIVVTGALLPDRKRVRIVVQDDGRGMAPEVVARVFDPFFTTRRNQGGTGLGLHIVFNLARNTLGGSITAFSTPGQGSRFELQIPCTSPEFHGSGAVPATPTAATPSSATTKVPS